MKLKYMSYVMCFFQFVEVIHNLQQLHIVDYSFFLYCVCLCPATHWLRKANRYLMIIRVLLGRDCRTLLMWTARSWRLSIAGKQHSHDTQEITHTIKHINTQRQKDVTLTDTGYEIMEDFLREKGVIQSPKVELEDTSNRVHVVVILVPCQRVLTYIRTRKQRGGGGGGGGLDGKEK